MTMMATWKTLFILMVGLNANFMDMGQFEDAMDPLGLPAYSFPLGGEFGMGFQHYYMNEHIIRWGFTAPMMYLESHQDGDYSAFRKQDVIIKFGYGYHGVEWMDTYTDLGFSIGEWEYLLLTDQFDGRAASNYYSFVPEAGFQFYLGKHAGLTVYGRYFIELGQGKELYSRDWTEDNFDELDLDYFAAGVNYFVRF